MPSFVSSLLKKSVNTIVGSSLHQDPSCHSQSVVKYGEGLSNVNRKGISNGAYLVSMAVEEFESGNQAVALDIFLSGLDKLIMSLPNLNDKETRQALKEKFISLEERLGIVSDTGSQSMKSDNVDSPTWFLSALSDDKSTAAEESRGDSFIKFKKVGGAMTDVIVRCVVLFKQSPLPGLLYLLFSYFLHLIYWIEGRFHVLDKIQMWSISCIKQLLAVDEKYHLHEFASEAIHTLLRLYFKSVVAYKETPSYLRQEKKEQPFSSWIWPTTMAT